MPGRGGGGIVWAFLMIIGTVYLIAAWQHIYEFASDISPWIGIPLLIGAFFVLVFLFNVIW